MRRKWGLVFTLAVLGGAALHFLYDVWPNPLTAVLAPVNESVWEHLKLLYWPFLAAAFVARARRGRRKRPLVRAAGGVAGRALAAACGVLSAPVRLRRARALARSAFVRAGDGRGVFARIPAAAQGAASRALRPAGDRGRGLWGGAGAVFLCAARSAYFPPVGAKKSAVCC